MCWKCFGTEPAHFFKHNSAEKGNGFIFLPPFLHVAGKTHHQLNLQP